MRKGEILAGTKNAYVAGMRALGRGLAVVGWPKSGVPDRSHRIPHWAYSLTAVHDSLAISELGVPWWSYKAIDRVDGWMSSRPKPLRVFEYGSGASTLWLADRASDVHSVEHHRDFAAYMAPVLESKPGVTLLVVEPTTTSNPKVPSAKEGHENLDFDEYVAAIDHIEGLFDLIVIDGRARQACLARAVDRLADEGIIVFDNSGRRRYRAAIEVSGLVEQRFRGLVPTLPYPDQTSILRRPILRS